MRKTTNILIAFFSILFFFQKNVNAQHVGSITKFEILPAYLTSDGKVKISNGSKTEVKYKVSFSRELSNTGAVGSYKPFNLTVMLSTPGSSNEIISFFPANKITSTNFKPNSSFLLDKEFLASIDNTKLVNGKPIILAYTVNDASFPIMSYDGKSYLVELPKNPSGPEITVNPALDKLVIINRGEWNTGSHVLRTDTQLSNEEEFYNLRMRGSAFYAYPKSEGYLPGVNLIYECVRITEDPTKATMYTTWIPNDPIWNVWKSSGNAFWAYDKQVAGTVPIYEYVIQANGHFYYSDQSLENNDGIYKLRRIAFYAFPMSITRPGPGGNDGDRPGRDTAPPRDGGAGDRPPAGGGRPTRG